MNTTYQTIKPTCNFCQQQYDMVYDGPTHLGPWAHACEGCSNEHMEIRWTRVQYKAKKGAPKQDTVPEVRITPRTKKMSCDEFFIKCPLCRKKTPMEADAEGDVFCDYCNAKLKAVPFI